MKYNYETFLSLIYTPLMSIVLLADIIDENSDSKWDFFTEPHRKNAQELISYILAIKLCAKHLLELRNQGVCTIKENLGNR